MPPLLAVAALIALVWGTYFVLRGELVAGCLGLLVLAACFSSPFLALDVGSVTLTLDRAALLLLIGAYFVQSRLGRTDPKPIGGVELLLMAFLGLLVGSTLLHDWQTDQLGAGGPMWRLIAGYLVPMIIYWIARQAVLDRSKISLVHGLLVCFGIYLAATGLAEVTKQWWAVFPRYIADPELGIHFGRARGPMIQSVSFGLYLGVCLLALWLWRWRFDRLGRLLLVTLIPLFLAGIFLSYTRSVWLGAGLGLMVALWLSLGKHWRPLFIGGFVLAGLLLVVMKSDFLLSFKRDDGLSAQEARKSVDMRGSFAYTSWLMFQERPLLGFGFGQFPREKLPYLSDRSTDLDLESIRHYVHHNTLLSLLTEVGLIGLGLFLAVLTAWGRTAWQLASSSTAPDWVRAQGILLLGTLGVYLCQLAFHELSYTPLDNSLVFLIAGVTMGLRAAHGPVSAPSEHRLSEPSAGLANLQPSP